MNKGNHWKHLVSFIKPNSMYLFSYILITNIKNNQFCIIWGSTFVAQVNSELSLLEFLIIFFQVLIVQFGDQWFSTSGLDIIQWIVCLLIGLSELIFGQVWINVSFIVSAPISKLSLSPPFPVNDCQNGWLFLEGCLPQVRLFYIGITNKNYHWLNARFQEVLLYGFVALN